MSDASAPIDVYASLESGRQRFLGVELRCGPGALVPRPETELLGRAAIDKVRGVGAPARVIDMCCGAGNLSAAVAAHVPDARVWASDLTDGCVMWARRNVEALALTDRVTVVQGDLFAGLAGHQLEGTVDVIVCNPPYISTSRLAADRAGLLELEPREAFDGGPYGLTIHQRVLREGAPFLRAGGWLLFEIGLGQERQVKHLFERVRVYSDRRSLRPESPRRRLSERARVYDDIELVPDAAGAVRVVAGRLKGQAP